MPEQSHPPYVSGALTSPRQLDRWLDVNPQNGPLKRTRKYLEIPGWVYPADYEFNGTFSDKVIQLNFNVSNKLSLRINKYNVVGIDYYSTDFDDQLAWFIAFLPGSLGVKNTLDVKRYRITADDGDTVRAEQYNGQPLPTTFCIEGWTKPSTTVSEGSSVNAQTLETSVLGNLDYRYGQDESINTQINDVVFDFNNISSVVGFNFYLPLFFNPLSQVI